MGVWWVFCNICVLIGQGIISIFTVVVLPPPHAPTMMLARASRFLEDPLCGGFQYAYSFVSNTLIFFLGLVQVLYNSLLPKSTKVWLHTFLQNLLITIIKTGPIPEHVSFIMDGNRRFAKFNNLPLQRGHEAGGFTLLTLVYICKKMGVRCVSAYAFSIENFNRPKEEVETLMTLFNEKLTEFVKKAGDLKDPMYGSRLKVVGDRRLLSPETRLRLEEVEELTKEGADFTFYVCFPYTSRNDIQHAIYKESRKYKTKKTQLSNITQESLGKGMYLDEFSNKCDILIRTSGHKRLSDFMLWQCHQNTTIEFVSTLWPDFTFIQMFLIFFRWSFFTTLQEYNTKDVSFFDKVSAELNILEKRKNTTLESLPDPPISISVLGN